MACFVISYQIANPLNKLAFTGEIKLAYPAYCPIDDNCWAVLTDQTAVQVRDRLSPKLGTGDRMFVLRSGTEAAWINAYGQANTDWLKKNL